jgi:acetyl esterase/lipase
MPATAPVLLLVHGGGWRRGDKAHGRLLDNKLALLAAGRRHPRVDQLPPAARKPTC